MNDKDSNFLIFFNKNKKGFTLIELLAVIVILSIILLIATPLIMGVIRDARKGAFQSTAYGLMTAAENKYMLNELGGNGRDFTSIYENNSLKEGENLDYKGTTPKEGVIAVMKGKVGLAITDGVWCAKKGYNDSKITIIKYDEEACILEDVPEIPEIGMITKGFDSDKGVNVPELLSGMTPIKWNDDREEIVYDENTDNDSWYDDWYDYDNKLWANAKTKDGSYWVWIPRYAYQFESGYSTANAGTINVRFLKDGTNDTLDNTIIELIPTHTGNKQNNFVLHPAFDFGGEQINGFWVAKFEPSVANQSHACYTSASEANCNNTNLVPKIIPNAYSWRYMQVGNQFTVAQNMKSNPAYGWNENEVDTHMMKNIEWGAVAYLSKSEYGAEEEVYINNSQKFTTGCAGNSVSEGSYNTGAMACQNEWDTEKGLKASTTHNITGIYDMSGGDMNM